MTQLGEGISIGMIVSDDLKHSEATCPWHKKETRANAKKMPKTSGNEDLSMPENDGGDLKKNMKDPEPKAKTVSVFYKQGAAIAFGTKARKKTVREYIPDTEEHDYPLQYAPHHLIPGNESLKNSGVIVYLGDDDVISNFNDKGAASLIKKGGSIGYDVNHGINGVWLPSPYALSMSNQWPSDAGLKALATRKGGAERFAMTELFKYEYAYAAIEANGKRTPKQFHMRHVEYSDKVREILDAMSMKLCFLAMMCPEAESDEDADKLKPPYGMRPRLDNLSLRLKGYLIGSVWRAPLFTDELSKSYVEMRWKEEKAIKDKARPVL